MHGLKSLCTKLECVVIKSDDAWEEVQEAHVGIHYHTVNCINNIALYTSMNSEIKTGKDIVI